MRPPIPRRAPPGARPEPHEVPVTMQLFAGLLLLPTALTCPPQKAGEAPPGMVFVEGGTTKIGSTVEEIEALGAANEKMFPQLVRETPQYTERVEDFFLMVNEVTNEQYAAYVEASGSQPPWTWGEQATNEARQAFLEEQNAAIQAAKAEGKQPPARQTFDAAAWWAKNWEGKEWAVPSGQETVPVTYVTYQDARNFARWGGMRLMTEVEFQRAGRGKGEGVHPWGDDPIDKERAATSESRLSAPLKVGSLPKGATESGIHDLVGNVWEWTSSPFSAYPKYKDFSIEIGKGKAVRTIPGVTQWDANKRVTVGGSFQNDQVVARLTVRRGASRDEATNSLGFRCAASKVPGADIAEIVLKDDVPPNTRPEGVDYDPSKTLATDRWISEPGSAPVENYAVVTSYDYAMFVPTIEVDAVSIKDLREDSTDVAPVPMGVFSTTVAMIEPELPPGTYIVAFRGSSKVPDNLPVDAAATPEGSQVQDQEPEASEESDEPLPPRVPEGYDWAQESFIFYRPDGEPVASLPTDQADLQYVRPAEPQVTVVDTTRQIDSGEVDDKGNPILIDDPIQVATFKVNTWVRVRNKSFTYTLRFVCAPGTFDGWRR